MSTHVGKGVPAGQVGPFVVFTAWYHEDSQEYRMSVRAMEDNEEAAVKAADKAVRETGGNEVFIAQVTRRLVRRYVVDNLAVPAPRG